MRSVYIKIIAAVVFCICIFSTKSVFTQDLQYDSNFNMSYIFFGDTDDYVRRVDGTKGALDVISPSYFEIDKNGELKITEKADREFVDKMHERGIKVVPFLSNHFDPVKGKEALVNRYILAGQIAEAVKTNNLDGVNVDIESDELGYAYRSKYTDFVRILREIIPQDKEVSVAVAANPYNTDYGMQGLYDYGELSKYSDYLMIMAYDENWQGWDYQGSRPGPVASKEFVEKSLQYAVERVPKEKIVLGIPFYGRYWYNGSNYGGYGIGLNQIDYLTEKYDSEKYFDYEEYSPYAVITIDSRDERPYIYSRFLDPGKYTVWYENEKSIKYKLSLVEKYGIKGTGSWSLGQESEGTWDYYDSYLNGLIFSDITGHWAEQDIIFLKEKGWIKGICNDLFFPNESLTRAQAVTMMVRILGLDAGELNCEFVDVKDHWASEEIETARQYGLVFGTGNKWFHPEAKVTREQMTVLTDRILEYPELPENTGEEDFKDVNSDKQYWSINAIVRMTNYGVISGYPDGLFYPKKNITRAQMAALVNNAMEYFPETY